MIKYKKGFKYQLAKMYKCEVGICPIVDIVTAYIMLSPRGVLRIREGYAWDGASGPTFDSKTSMRGSLIHDALYQLMREGELSHHCRKQADIELYKACREDGMSWVRAKIWYNGVRIGANFASLPKNKKETLTAP